MHRYFFDLYDHIGFAVDEDGQLMNSREQARAEAIRILCDIAQEELPDGKSLMVKVRDDAGVQILEATLTLKAAWT